MQTLAEDQKHAFNSSRRDKHCSRLEQREATTTGDRSTKNIKKKKKKVISVVFVVPGKAIFSKDLP